MKREQIKDNVIKFIEDKHIFKGHIIRHAELTIDEDIFLVDLITDFYLSQPQDNRMVEALKDIQVTSSTALKRKGYEVASLKAINKRADQALTEAKEGGGDEG